MESSRLGRKTKEEEGPKGSSSPRKTVHGGQLRGMFSATMNGSHSPLRMNEHEVFTGRREDVEINTASLSQDMAAQTVPVSPRVGLSSLSPLLVTSIPGTVDMASLERWVFC